MAGTGSEHRFKNQGDVKTIPWPSGSAAAIYKYFDSPADFLRMACNEKTAWTSERASRSNNPKLGTESWEQAVQLAHRGWPEGRAQLKRNLDIHAISSARIVSDWTYDYAGAYPDVPRFLGGDMDCMVDFRPDVDRHRPVVKIAVSTVTREDVSGHRISNWGAALVSWIDELEDKGRRVEVTWISCSHPFWITDSDKAVNKRGPRVAFSFRLKEPDQPVELDRLAFWIMHPAAQRRIQFAAKEQLPIEPWYKDAYGFPEWDDEIVRSFCPPGSMLFQVGDGDSTVDAGIERLKKATSAFLERGSSAKTHHNFGIKR